MASPQALTIINVPSDVDSIIKGKSLAPGAFRSADFASRLAQVGYNVEERNALSDGPKTWTFDSSFEPNGVRNENENVAVNHEVKNAVADAVGVDVSSPAFQVVIGGGCSISPAIMSALWERLAPKRVGLLYVDGDADLTVPGEPGSSGNLASMTFTHLTMIPGALESMKPFTRPDGSGVIDSSNVVIFGLNVSLQGNTRSQIGHLMDDGYRVITSAAVAKDPSGRAKQALAWLEERVDYIFVHLDVDAIDATEFPLANVANRTGVNFQQIMTAMKIFLTSKKACGLSIAEVNPDHDPGLKMTNMLVNELVDGLKQRLHI